MGKNTSVVIGLEQDKFLREMVAAGRFATTSEAVRAGLSLLEERELALAALRKAIDEGEASGGWHEIDIEKFLEIHKV